MGETPKPFQLSFNSALKVEFQGSRVTSDGGLVGRIWDEMDYGLRGSSLSRKSNRRLGNEPNK